MSNTAFTFPDENIIDGKENDENVEIEVADDTPEVDKNRKPMKEAPVDVTDEELDNYSDSVKKRIQHFTKGYHEERRAKETALREREEAVNFAQNLITENNNLKGSIGHGQAALLEQAKRVVEGEVETAKRAYKAAHEAGDSDGLVVAQDALTSAKIRADKLYNFRPAPLQPDQNVVQPPQGQVRQAPAAPTVDQKAQNWREGNSWFGSDEEMTAVALAVHKKLVESNVSPVSDEYYDKINSRMRQLFPDAFSSEKSGKKSTIVGSATRSTAPRKIVLTQTQVNIAKRLGVPLELYAKQVAKDMRK